MNQPTDPVPAIDPIMLVPPETFNAQAVVHIPVGRSVEEDDAGLTVFSVLPLVWDEVGIGEQEIKNIDVQDGHGRELLEELPSTNGLAPLLETREVEHHLRWIEAELAALLVIFDIYAFSRNRIGVAVDDARHQGKSVFIVHESSPSLGIVCLP